MIVKEQLLETIGPIDWRDLMVCGWKQVPLKRDHLKWQVRQTREEVHILQPCPHELQLLYI